MPVEPYHHGSSGQSIARMRAISASTSSRVITLHHRAGSPRRLPTLRTTNTV